MTLNLPTQEERKFLNTQLKFLITPRNELDRDSLLEVFTDAIRQSDLTDLLNFVKGLKSFVDSDDSYLKEALEILRNHPIKIVITDQRMPEMTGVQFLEAIIPEYPETIRMLEGSLCLFSQTYPIGAQSPALCEAYAEAFTRVWNHLDEVIAHSSPMDC